jgi:hypothetical protein
MKQTSMSPPGARIVIAAASDRLATANGRRQGQEDITMNIERHEAGTAICLVFEFGPQLDRSAVRAMASAVEHAMKDFGDLRLVLDFGNTVEFEASAFVSIDATITSAKSIGPVSHYAVVGAPDIAAAAVESFGKLLPLDARTFAAGEIDQARSWCCTFD